MQSTWTLIVNGFIIEKDQNGNKGLESLNMKVVMKVFQSIKVHLGILITHWIVLQKVFKPSNWLVEYLLLKKILNEVCITILWFLVLKVIRYDIFMFWWNFWCNSKNEFLNTSNLDVFLKMLESNLVSKNVYFPLTLAMTFLVVW